MKIEKFMVVPYGGPSQWRKRRNKKIAKNKGKKGLKIKKVKNGGLENVSWCKRMGEEKSNYHVIGKSSWNFNELYLKLREY